MSVCSDVLGGVIWMQRMEGHGSWETDCGDLFTCLGDDEGSFVPRGGAIPPSSRFKSYLSSSSSSIFSLQGVKGPVSSSSVCEGHCVGIVLEIEEDDESEFKLVIAIG